MLTVQAIESTPNPCARKWILSAAVWNQSHSFMSKEDAQDHPLGTRLMHLEGVRTVLVCNNWCTINIHNARNWRKIQDAASAVIEEWIREGSPT